MVTQWCMIMFHPSSAGKKFSSSSTEATAEESVVVKHSEALPIHHTLKSYNHHIISINMYKWYWLFQDLNDEHWWTIFRTTKHNETISWSERSKHMIDHNWRHFRLLGQVIYQITAVRPPSWRSAHWIRSLRRNVCRTRWLMLLQLYGYGEWFDGYFGHGQYWVLRLLMNN